MIKSAFMPPTEYSRQFARMEKPVQYRLYGGWTYRIFPQFENGEGVPENEADKLINDLKVKGVTAKKFPWFGTFLVYERWQK